MTIHTIMHLEIRVQRHAARAGAVKGARLYRLSVALTMFITFNLMCPQHRNVRDAPCYARQYERAFHVLFRRGAV